MPKLKKAYSFSSLNFSTESSEEDKIKKYDLIEGAQDLPSKPELGDSAFVKFHMFRTGQWDHPWYGLITFDESYIDGLVKNFYAGIVSREISFDIDHGPSRGDTEAYGWMRELVKEKGFIETPMGQKEIFFLDVIAELNRQGIEVVKDKRFAYCSAEIDSDYTNYERHKIDTEDEEEAQTVLSHGPAVTGCAFTNRPFIPNLSEVAEFSENNSEGVKRELTVSEPEGTGVQFFSYRDVPTQSKNFSAPIGVEKTEEDETPQDTPEPADEESSKTEEDTGALDMEFAELISKMKSAGDLAAQIKALKEGRSEFGEAQSEVIDEMIASKEAALEAQESSQETVQEFAQRQRKMQEADKARKRELADLRLELAKAKEGEWSQRVKAFASELRENDHHESLVKVVEQKLGALTDKTRNQTFSILNDEGEGTDEQGLMDMLREFFEAIPESARLDTGEELNGNQNFETPVDPDAPANKADVDGEPQAEPDKDEEDGGDEETFDREAAIKAYMQAHGGTKPDEFMIPHIDVETGQPDLSALLG